MGTEKVWGDGVGTLGGRVTLGLEILQGIEQGIEILQGMEPEDESRAQ
jgi:hypothetical protein